MCLSCDAGCHSCVCHVMQVSTTHPCVCRVMQGFLSKVAPHLKTCKGSLQHRSPHSRLASPQLHRVHSLSKEPHSSPRGLCNFPLRGPHSSPSRSRRGPCHSPSRGYSRVPLSPRGCFLNRPSRPNRCSFNSANRLSFWNSR